ncbi:MULTISPECIES: hypothetical protein [Sorangium]|uniref:hypothetical protein n=1 Tax=Sorangium TaxID=39643 RepID=UPI00101A6250|nr:MULTISPECIES: hypothetical protein [Sorangium]
MDALEARHDLARERFAAGTKSARAAPRMRRDIEETWADYETARRLRDTVAAAVMGAQARVAVIEADACAAIAAAFKQFKKDRAWRRRSTRPSGAQGRQQRTGAKPKSPDELAEMVADAKKAAACVIADRSRLIARLVDARAAAAALRGLLATVPAGAPEEAASIRRRITLCEEHGAYVEQQLLASARSAQQLVAGLRELVHGLPEPVASALARLEARGAPVKDSN